MRPETPAAVRPNGVVLLQGGGTAGHMLPCSLSVRNKNCHRFCVLSYENYNTHTIACCTRLPGLLQLAFAFSMSHELCAAIYEEDQTSRGFLCALLSQHSQGGNNIDFLWDRNDVTGN